MPAFEGEAETVVDHWVVFTRWLKAAFRVKAAVSFMFAMNQVNVRSRWREKVICSERNNPAMREPEHMSAIAGIYAQADLVVFQTERVRALFGEEIRSRSIVIPNPVTMELRWEGGSPRVVNVGRLTPQKNQALLLRAFARFHAAHPGYTLSVYGEGPLREMLTRLAEELGVSDTVFLEGNVPDLHRRIRDAEMFVLSSDYEGMSNALLECMAMGMPCISTACEGSDELIQSGVSGILTETGDEEALYRAMCRLAEDPALRQELGEAAHRTARAYRTELIANRWRRLIDGDDGNG
jgi:glycosyltransferase involved in cell wall biosynthesis